MTWQRTGRADPAVARLADDHYSRQKRGARQFSPNGRVVTLYLVGPQWPFRAAAGWVWWHPKLGVAERKDGFTGWWQCSFFRNESDRLSSELIQEAIPWVIEAWGLPPFGFDTYVWPDKIRSTNPGYCYQKAGWTLTDHWTQDGKKRRLYLPVEAL